MKINIAIIGLGYVGLPLARLLATKYPVTGFDINTSRIKKLNQGIDDTLEVEEKILKSVLFSSSPPILASLKLETLAKRIKLDKTLQGRTSS